MVVNAVGLSAIVFFYIIILLMGLWISKTKGVLNPKTSEDLLLAGRKIGVLVGIFTLTATEVGGAFLNGTAEEVFRRGLLWCIVPFGYSLSLTINGLLFAKTMRERGYVTIFDPIQETFGETMGAFCFIIHFVGDICWTGAVLAVLGTTLAAVVQLQRTASILVSAGVAILYTLTGGMFSVAYTDVLQLGFIGFGMFISLPFVLSHNAIRLKPEDEWNMDWLGEIRKDQIVAYLDALAVPLLGGLPWQPYFQRVLSMKSTRQVQVLSVCATVLCIVLVIPPVLIGAVARRVDWNQTGYGQTLYVEQAPMVLPLSLQYLVPQLIAFFGLGAVSAAVMSSIDSAMLGAASCIARNVYQQLLKPKASEREIIWVTRLGILLVGAAGAAIAFSVKSVYGIWFIASDLSYVILFPHFVMSIWCPGLCNSYGSCVGYICGLVLRGMFGEKTLNIPPVLPTTNLPVRTIAATLTIVVIIVVSNLARYVFAAGIVKDDQDFCSCFRRNLKEPVVLKSMKIKDPGGTDIIRSLDTGQVKSNGELKSGRKLSVVDETSVPEEQNRQ